MLLGFEYRPFIAPLLMLVQRKAADTDDEDYVEEGGERSSDNEVEAGDENEPIELSGDEEQAAPAKKPPKRAKRPVRKAAVKKVGLHPLCYTCQYMLYRFIRRHGCLLCTWCCHCGIVPAA